jgi:hypothetical protein
LERKGEGGIEADIEDGAAGESIATAVVGGPYHHQDDADDAQDVHQGRQLLVGHPGIRSHGSPPTHTASLCLVFAFPLPFLALRCLALPSFAWLWTRAEGETRGEWRWRNGWRGRQQRLFSLCPTEESPRAPSPRAHLLSIFNIVSSRLLRFHLSFQ